VSYVSEIIGVPRKRHTYPKAIRITLVLYASAVCQSLRGWFVLACPDAFSGSPEAIPCDEETASAKTKRRTELVEVSASQRHFSY